MAYNNSLMYRDNTSLVWFYYLVFLMILFLLTITSIQMKRISITK